MNGRRTPSTTGNTSARTGNVSTSGNSQSASRSAMTEGKPEHKRGEGARPNERGPSPIQNSQGFGIRNPFFSPSPDDSKKGGKQQPTQTALPTILPALSNIMQNTGPAFLQRGMPNLLQGGALNLTLNSGANTTLGSTSLASAFASSFNNYVPPFPTQQPATQRGLGKSNESVRSMNAHTPYSPGFTIFR